MPEPILNQQTLRYQEIAEHQDLFIDTCMEMSMRANECGSGYLIFHPVGFDEQPAISLGPHGLYGKGTHYPFSWHLGRISDIEKKPEEKLLLVRTYKNISGGVLIKPRYSSDKVS